MSFSKSIIYTIVSAFVIAGCKSAQKNKTSVSQIQEIKVQPSQGPYRPSVTRKADLLHTKLELSFDWKKQYVNGIALLKLKPYFYSIDTLVLDAKGFDIHSIQLIGKDDSRKSLDYKYDSKKLSIKLDRLYSKADTFHVEIDYTAKPNEAPIGGSEAITSDKGIYFINPDGKDPYKPRQIWTQGETEASSKWFPTIDATNERCTQEMYITVEKEFEVLSNGEFVYSLDNGDGTKTDYWKLDLPHAPYLFMMAIGDYAVVEDKWRNLELKYYVEPEYEKYAKGIFGNTPEMIGFFSDKLNYTYPWNKYSQVVVRDYVSGAMENTTATVFMEALQIDDHEMKDKNWDYIIAHELFHHWFGDLVTCESWANLPLNESFANYSEYLWAEHKYGIDEADYHAESEQDEYLQEALTKIEPLIRFHYYDHEDMFDRHSYNKGGRVLHMLRKYVGDEAFYKSLEKYLKANQFSAVEIHNLRLAFEQVTGEDLNWFFNQWFLQPGHPDLQISQEYQNGILKLKIWQKQDTTFVPVYRLPLQADVWVNGKKQRLSFVIDKAYNELKFPLASQPQLVLVDPEFSLLGTKKHTKANEEWIFQYRNAERYYAKKEAIEHLREQLGKEGVNDADVKAVLLEALNDKFWAIREYAISVLLQQKIGDPTLFEKPIEKLALNDPKSDVRASAIFFLSRYFNASKLDVYKKGLKDSSYAVLSASLTAYLRTGDKSVNIDWNRIEKINNLELVITLGGYYLSEKNTSKFLWLNEKLQRNKSNPRYLYNLLYLYGEYLLIMPVEVRNEGLKFLDEVIATSKYDQIKSVAFTYIEKIKSLNNKEK